MHRPEPRAIPAFARAFPSEPRLDALVEAFARGDYARVRAEAPEFQRSTEDEAVRAAARTLVERTAPDPLAVKMLLLTAALLIALAGYWIVNGKPPAAAPSPASTATVERVRQ